MSTVCDIDQAGNVLCTYTGGEGEGLKIVSHLFPSRGCGTVPPLSPARRRGASLPRAGLGLAAVACPRVVVLVG